MKVIVAGSRNIEDYNLIEKSIIDSKFEVDIICSGVCRGVDKLGQRWANENKKLIKKFPADWKQFDRRAGPIRNKQMADYADALILIWDGFSRGSNNMLKTAEKNNLKIFQVKV